MWVKVKFVVIGADEVLLKELASRVGCKIGKLLLSYPGLLVGANLRSRKTWNPVVEQFEKRLAGWPKNYLSLGVRMLD